jgi:uncharacterized protein YecT (DUF1311 family)
VAPTEDCNQSGIRWAGEHADSSITASTSSYDHLGPGGEVAGPERGGGPMGQQRASSPVAALAGGAGGPGAVRVAVLAAAVALISGLAACGGSATPSSTSSPGATGATATPSVAAAAPTASAAATGFVPIVEPFDPGHPARKQPSPASCGGQATTVAIAQCYDAKTEATDAAIDAAQLARYRGGAPAEQAAILADDSAWLAARRPVCAEAFQSGGTVDGIDVAACLLGESTARLNAVRGITPPAAMLNATDNTDPSALSWYTTPEGSRIAMVDTQGDNSGGAIIAWVIIGGADGFVVNPSQFYFRDGSFTDHGVIQPPDPSFHRVLPGVEYQFEIDYTHLSADPNSAKGTGGYAYVPGVPVAIWR